MADETKAPAAAKTKGYRIKGGADAIKHPSLGITITKDHLSGPNAATFITAIRKEDAKKRTKGWFETNIEAI